MTKVQAKVKPKSEWETIDVELPLYRHHDCGGDSYDSDYYTRIEKNMREITINVSSSHSEGNEKWELEIENNKILAGERDWVLCEGQYRSNKQEFDKVWAQFKAAVWAAEQGDY
jgi:hypothetical protein